jgi:hypothetical protein
MILFSFLAIARVSEYALPFAKHADGQNIPDTHLIRCSPDRMSDCPGVISASSIR